MSKTQYFRADIPASRIIPQLMNSGQYGILDITVPTDVCTFFLSVVLNLQKFFEVRIITY